MATQTSEYKFFFDDVQFGIDIKEARQKLAISQRELAEKVGFESSSGIGVKESRGGDNSITMRRFLTICFVLDLNPHDYFDMEKEAIALEYISR